MNPQLRDALGKAVHDNCIVLQMQYEQQSERVKEIYRMMGEAAVTTFLQSLPSGTSGEMTIDRAMQDLRIMATSIVVDNGDYVKRLNAIADFLESITWIEREP